MTDYLTIPQASGKPILWEYCKPDGDGSNVVTIPQQDGLPIIAKCPPPTEDGENVIVVPQPDGTNIICGKCKEGERCVYNNKIAYIGYAEIDIPEGGIYLADIAALNTWMADSDNYQSTIMVSGEIEIDEPIIVPSYSSYKFLGENSAKFINENLSILQIVTTGVCPCLVFQDIDFHATTGLIFDDFKGAIYSSGINDSYRGITINMTDETILPGYLCKFIVDGVYTRLYKPNADDIEDVGFFTSTLLSGQTVDTDLHYLKTTSGTISDGSLSVGNFLSSQADSWIPKETSGSGTFFINDDNEDETFDYNREQINVARVINCKFTYYNTSQHISLFSNVSFTNFTSCDFSGIESGSNYAINIVISGYSSFINCDFSNCKAQENLSIGSTDIDNCVFDDIEVGLSESSGEKNTLNITGTRLLNQDIELTINQKTLNVGYVDGNSIILNFGFYINSNIEIVASDGKSIDGAGGDGGDAAFGAWGYPDTFYHSLTSYKINSFLSGVGGDGGAVGYHDCKSCYGAGGFGAYFTNWDDSKYVINSTVYGKGGDGGAGINSSGFDGGSGGHGGNGHTIAGNGGNGANGGLLGHTNTGGHGGYGGSSVEGEGGKGGDAGNGGNGLVDYGDGGDGGDGGSGGSSKNNIGGNGGAGGDGGTNHKAQPYAPPNHGGQGGNGGSSINENAGNGGNGGAGGNSTEVWYGGGYGGWGGYGGSSTNGNGGNGGDGGDGGDGGVYGIYANNTGGYGGHGGNSTTAYGGDGGDGGDGGGVSGTDGLGGCGGTGLLGDGADGIPYNWECDFEW